MKKYLAHKTSATGQTVTFTLFICVHIIPEIWHKSTPGGAFVQGSPKLLHMEIFTLGNEQNMHESKVILNTMRNKVRLESRCALIKGF
jgi:hypothetical protein